MKKIPILLLLTLISSFAFAPSRSSFATMEENGTTWWSVEELLDFYPEVEAEKDAECGDDQDCRMEFDFNLMEKGGEYRALSDLMSMQFWVTGVNPDKQTIDVLFFDEEIMLRHMGIREKLTLERLTMGWFDEPTDEVFYRSYDELASGLLPGFHVLFTSNPENLADITPWRETTLSISDTNLVNNTHGKIAYRIYAGPFNAVGNFDYSSCFSKPDYVSGQGCKMYVSADQWISFFPSRNENEPNELTNQNSSTDNSPSDSEPTPPVEEPLVVEQPIIDRGTELSEESREDSVSNETTLSLAPDIKAPNTGVGSCDRAVEFPWWFMLMLLIGDIVALWLFWPTKSKKSRKNV